MELKGTTQVLDSQLFKVELDYLICSSGFEERSTYLASKLDLERIKNKLVIGFNSFRDSDKRIACDKFFSENHFRFIESNGDDSNFINEIKKTLTEIADVEEINIGIDYSTMTRVWYSSIISCIRNLEDGPGINLYFYYSFSAFTKPINSDIRNIHIGPIKGFSQLTIPDKPTALIIGLGYEKERAFGLTEYLDAETYVFYTDSSKGLEYQKYIETANSSLLSYLKPENIFEYSLDHLEFAESLLFSLCKSLTQDYRIVLAPTGPKPFTLLCLLLSLRFSNIDVWRISAGDGISPTNKVAQGGLSCYLAKFSC